MRRGRIPGSDERRPTNLPNSLAHLWFSFCDLALRLAVRTTSPKPLVRIDLLTGHIAGPSTAFAGTAFSVRRASVSLRCQQACIRGIC